MKRSKKLWFGLFLVFSIMFGSFLNASSDVSATTQTFSFNSSNHPSTYERFQFNSFTPTYFDFYCSDFSDGDANTLRLSFSSFDSFSANSSVILSCSRGYVANSNSRSTRIYIPSGSPVKFFNLEGTATFNLIFSDETGGGIVPSGSLSITENGTYDVSSYAEVVVDVPPEIIQADYHNDLISINNSILVVAAVGLVIYFFYAIYRMILGGRR